MKAKCIFVRFIVKYKLHYCEQICKYKFTRRVLDLLDQSARCISADFFKTMSMAFPSAALNSSGSSIIRK